ncbi:MAG: dicarboxylate/amino acid:cation symporter [Bacteriovoracaceae bacterium]
MKHIPSYDSFNSRSGGRRCTHPYAADENFVWVSTNIFAPTGQIFLRLIFMIVVPMVFCGLILGVSELTSHHGLGKVVKKTLFYTLVASSLSVVVGITLVNIVKPGVGLNIDRDALKTPNADVEKIANNASAAKSAVQSLVEIIPKNPLDSAVKALDGEMLSLMFFALFFGIALALTKKEESTIFGIFEQVYAACMYIVDQAMKLAPFAVFALVFNTSFKFGHTILISLFYYVLVVVGALLIQQFVVYSALLKFIGKINPFKFYKDCSDVYLYAFATASSNATLPRSLETAEQTLKLPPEVSRFVLTVGSTANQNGTALFEGITVLFLAQVYGIELSLANQVTVVLMSILAGVGTAGVPGGSLPLIMILLKQMGIPAEGMGIILGVDRFLDMCRTTINVSGDLVIAALVSKDANQS